MMIVIMFICHTEQGRVVESQGVTLLTELEWQYGTLVDRDQEEVHRPREVELSTILRSFKVKCLEKVPTRTFSF